MIKGINCVTISDDSKGLAISFLHSIQVYNFFPIRKVFQKEFINYEITHISLTNGGNLIAFSCIPLKKEKKSTKVFIWSTQYAECISQLVFEEEIVSLCIKPQYLLITFSNSISLYNIERTSAQFEMTTYFNSYGASDISINNQSSLLAICGNQLGSVNIYEISDITTPITFLAHQHPVNIIKFSSDSKMIATSSEMGTLIRLFDSISGNNLSVFRRGSLSQQILSLSFNKDNSNLCAISSNGTLHLFDSTIRNSNTNDPPRAISKISIEKSKISFMNIDENNEILVLLSNGFLYRFQKSGLSLQLLNKIFVLSN